MSCWSKPELESMLEDVVNELDLSDGMIEEHGPHGTAPAKLVRLVLDRKDLEIRMLKQGMVAIEPKQPPEPACTCTITKHERQENRSCPVHIPRLAPEPEGDGWQIVTENSPDSAVPREVLVQSHETGYVYSTSVRQVRWLHTEALRDGETCVYAYWRELPPPRLPATKVEPSC